MSGRPTSQVGIVVTDPQRAAGWQERLFGAQRAAAPAHGARMVLGRTALLLVESEQDAEALRRPADEVGACHVCVGVPDIREAGERLRSEGLEPSTPPTEIATGLWSLYFRDHDGLQYQLLETGKAASIHHFAYNVSSLDETLEWYARVLGITPTYRSESSGPQVPRMLGAGDSSFQVALLPLDEIQLELMEWQRAGSPAQHPGDRDVGAWQLGDAQSGSLVTDPDGQTLFVPGQA